MSNIGERKQVIDDTLSLKYITSTLRDVSAIELRTVWGKFLQNERYYTELQQLYQLVWMMAGSSSDILETEHRHDETLHIAYTTNRHFYGLINYDVMQTFFEAIDSSSRCIVLGKTGKEIWEDTKEEMSKNVTFTTFEADAPNSTEVRSLLKDTDGYRSVVVYYPRFTSVYEQHAGALDITYRPSGDSAVEQELKKESQYFLEPDILEMIAFFNTQVRYMLLERMLLESKLSQIAARLVRMDTADQNASDMLKYEQLELSRAQRAFSSSRMLETVVGYIQWHQTNN